MRNASGQQGENERQSKTKVNRNTKIPSISRVSREFLEVSRFSRANGRQGNIQKVFRTCKVVVVFLLIRPIVVVVLPSSLSSPFL